MKLSVLFTYLVFPRLKRNSMVFSSSKLLKLFSVLALAQGLLNHGGCERLRRCSQILND